MLPAPASWAVPMAVISGKVLTATHFPRTSERNWQKYGLTDTPPSTETSSPISVSEDMARITSAVRNAMPSSRDCIMSRGSVSRDSPIQSPAARRSQCGQARPDRAGTNSRSRSTAAGLSKLPREAWSVKSPSPLAHSMAEPAQYTPPSRAYSGVPPSYCQATVGRSPWSGDRIAFSPVTSSAKAPVPNVIFASPTPRQP